MWWVNCLNCYFGEIEKLMLWVCFGMGNEINGISVLFRFKSVVIVLFDFFKICLLIKNVCMWWCIVESLWKLIGNVMVMLFVIGGWKWR